MLLRLFGKNTAGNVPQSLFATILEQSRSVPFYADFGVPDSVMGRFDMLALHTYLFARRLRREDEHRASDLNQEVFDLFVDDIERALRQLGIGDTTVPKRKKRMVRSFYGQIEDFDQTLDAEDVETLSERARRRYGSEAENFNANALVQYMIKADKHLTAQDYKDILSGQLFWPEL